jgi:hypothetical protein
MRKSEAVASPFWRLDKKRKLVAEPKVAMGPRFLLAMLCLFALGAARNRTQRTAGPPVPTPAPALVNLSVRATPLEALGEIGLQTRVPIGIIPGRDAGALCRTKTTFVFLGEDPRSALDAIAQTLHYTLNQEEGVFVLAAPDVTPHQRDVLEYRFRVYHYGKKSIVQSISMQLSAALWVAFSKTASVSYGGSIDHSVNGHSVNAHSVDAHSVDAPKISLPPVLHEVTAQEIAGLVVKTPPYGIYLSRIHPSRVASPDDLTIQLSSYGDPKQLKLDLRCQQ